MKGRKLGKIVQKDLKGLNIFSLVRTSSVILILSLLIWAFFFHNFRTVALLNIADLNNEYAKQTELVADSIDNLVKTFGSHVFQSDACKQLRSPTQHTNSEIVYALRELSEYASSSEFIESINIYNPSLECVYTTSPRLMTVDGVKPERIPTIDIMKAYDDFEEDRYIKPLFHRNEENGEIDGIYYLFYDTYHSTDPTSSMMALKIAPKWYVEKLISMDPYKNIVLLDNHDKILFSNFQVDKGYTELIPTSEGNSYVTATVDGTKKVFFYSDLKPLGWKIISVVNEKDCLSHLYRLRQSVSFIFIIVGFVIVLLSIIMFIFVYDPYKRMKSRLHDISPELPEKKSLSEDEILSAIIDENVTNKYITDFGLLLNGEIDHLDGFTPPFVLGISSMKDKERLETMLTQASRNHVTIDYNKHEGYVFLLSIKEDVDYNAIDMMVEDGSFLTLTHHYDDITTTSEHYRKLSDIYYMKFTMESIIVFEEELEKRTGDISDEDTILSSLFSSLRSRKSEEAMDSYNRFFQSFSSFDSLTIHHSLKNLEVEIGKCQKELNLTFSDELPDVDELMKASQSMKDMQDSYLPFIIQIEDGYRSIKKASDSRIAIQIENILDKNYRRYDFTTIELSETLGRNLNYLSKVYKETYGISITNSIMKKRAETAKSLLESTDANVEDIAVKLGFENVKYFYVIFKKFVGMTPLQYRKNLKA